MICVLRLIVRQEAEKKIKPVEIPEGVPMC